MSEQMKYFVRRIAKKLWVTIPARYLWEAWETCNEDYVIAIECPYCGIISYNISEGENHLCLGGCGCRIPKDPTSLFIQIKFIKIKRKEKKGTRRSRR